MVETTVAVSPPDDDPPTGDPERGRLSRRPPRLFFHGILIAAALAELWSFSFPGVHFFGMIVPFWVLGIASIIWLVRLLAYGMAWRHRRHNGPARWFLVAPLGGLLVLGLLMANVPLKARWQVGKHDFEQALQGAERAPAKWEGRIDRRVGTYRITHVGVVEHGVLFYEHTGALSDDAGFAYLPNGPSPDMSNGNFENPQWVALGDHWYSWVASW